MKNSTKIFYLFLGLFIVGCSSPSEHKNTDLVKEGTLTVGVDLSYPPFETVDKKGDPTGITIDILKGLAKNLGLKLDVKNTAFAGLITGLQTHSFDIIMSSISVTKEREEVVSFSDPYAHMSLGLLFSSQSLYHNEQELINAGSAAKIIVRKGTTSETLAQELFPKAQILKVETVNAMVLDVSQYKSDAMIYDPLTLYENYKNNPTKTRVNFTPLTGSKAPWAIAISKNNTNLKVKIDAFLKQYKKSGNFDVLTKKYLRDIQKEFKKQNIPFFFSS